VATLQEQKTLHFCDAIIKKNCNLDFFLKG